MKENKPIIQSFEQAEKYLKEHYLKDKPKEKKEK